MEINEYIVTIKSLLFTTRIKVTATSEDAAIDNVMAYEPYAPRHCFTAQFIKCIYRS